MIRTFALIIITFFLIYIIKYDIKCTLMILKKISWGNIWISEKLIISSNNGDYNIY